MSVLLDKRFPNGLPYYDLWLSIYAAIDPLRFISDLILLLGRCTTSRRRMEKLRQNLNSPGFFVASRQNQFGILATPMRFLIAQMDLKLIYDMYVVQVFANI